MHRIIFPVLLNSNITANFFKDSFKSTIARLRKLISYKGASLMPVISMFYGIIIRMYLLDNKHHNLPHIHAKYAEFEASVNILDGEILVGDLPRKQLRLVQAWIELHRDELTADWELATNGENPYKISPL
jgi:Domain of unknown function (DUF4160)